jgi:hypothetical protein
VIFQDQKDHAKGFRILARKHFLLKSFWLRKTDWLIDQIVYKLYSLNEEEIKIVEDQAN